MPALSPRKALLLDLLRRRHTPPDAAAPIAIIGLGLSAPGAGADGVRGSGAASTREGWTARNAFWQALKAGRHAITDIPADRWNGADPALFDPDKARAVASGRAYARWGGFLDGGIDRFDALFFGISPREAELMDPQERLFLEVAWQTVEDAGLTRAALAGQNVAVFAGAMFGHYQLFESASGIPNSSFASIANRVSHMFDWRGPSLAVDTMCSSALAAIALACASLRRGESALALAGGVNLISHPRRYALLSQGRFASTDGRCRAFGEGGDGYVPGEGAGAVLLKPLDAAMRDGDPVWGVIRGIGMNHGGRSAGSGFTVPSPVAQGEAIAQALSEAGLAGRDISYVEAHGTGTALGDPVELAGLARGYGDAAARDTVIALGAVKSNIGHLEAAAGIAGLAKVLMGLREGVLVPSLPHAETLNPHCDFEGAGFALQRDCAPWVANGAPRRAGLSAFGAGGTNVHLVIEEAPARAQTAVDGPVFVPLSAPSEQQLIFAAEVLADWIEGTPDARLADIAHTLATGREPMAERLAVTAATPGELAGRLRAFARGETQHVLRGQAGSAPEPAANDPDAEARRFIAGGAPLPAPAGRRISLPGLPFARERFWLAPAAPASGAPLHPLIAANVSTLDGIAFRRAFSAADPWLRDHRFAGTMLLPGVATLEMARAAAAFAHPVGTVTGLKDVLWLRPLAVPADGGAVDATLRLTPGGARFELASAEGVHARGSVLLGAGLESETVDLAAIAARCGAPVPGAASYQVLAAHGLEYGPALRVLEEVRAGDGEVLARLVLPQAEPGLLLDPAALDGALQVLANLPLVAGDAPALPFCVDEIRWTGAALPPRLTVHARRAAGGRAAADISIMDDAGRVLVRLSGVAVRPVAQTIAPPTPPADAPPAAPAEQAEAPLLARLTALMGQELRLAPERIDPQEDFERYGLQSVQIMDMTAALEDEFGALPKTLFFEYRTLADLAGYFRAEHAATVAARYAAAPLAPAVVAGTVAAAPRPEAAPPPSDAIAIIGLAGRYPDAPDLPAFWRNLIEGRDSIGPVPADRWDPDDLPVTAEGKPVSRWGGWLADADRFDARFFRMAPREAALIDPQERLFLETCWQALEDAALTRAGLKGARVGVYVGVMNGLYQLHGPMLSTPDKPVGPASPYWSIANRVSAVCDFSGPSMAVDTACSASLTAIHLACLALRTGEAEVAVAGGVNIASHPQKYLQLAELNFSAADGRCRSFGAGGTGYVPGEGVGAVVLKPLAAALRDGDPVRAVIRGSALTHSGTTNGYTVPSPNAQAEAIGTALARAGLTPDDIDIVEAHGTGTALGDPIEIRALNRAFAGRQPGRPVPIGSVKSNIGHLESAAGIAGLTKLVLQLKHRTLLPSLHGEPANPDVDFAGGPFVLSRETAPWPAAPEGRVRRAGLSSFGAGGANAHLVVEEFSAPPGITGDAGEQLILLSARGAEALRARAADLLAWLQADGAQAPLGAIAATLRLGREAMADRLALLVTSRAELEAALAAVLAGRTDARIVGAGSVALPEAPAARRALAQTLVAQAEPAALARHWCAGLEIDWRALGDSTPRLNLPPYRFAGGRHWLPVRPIDRVGSAAASAPSEPAAPTLMFAPVWVADAATPAAPAGPLLVVSGDKTLPSALATLWPAPVRVARADADWPALLNGPAAPGAVLWHAEDAAETSFHTLFALLRALARRRGAPLNLLCLHAETPAGTALAGLLRTAAHELPGLRPRLLALPAEPAEIITALTADHAPGTELRRTPDGMQRRAWRELADGPQMDLPRGPWLITGGAGGLGLAVAHALAAPGMGFMLTGRSPASPQIEAALAGLHAKGAQALYARADVADEAMLAAALADMRARLGPPVAVLHAAGVIRDALILNKTEADISAVLAPKLNGVEILDRLTRNDPLELFALCSSLAAVTGNPGQSDYAFANRFLDAFAEARRGPGRTLSVNWPYWRDGGMRLGPSALAAMARLGLAPLDTAPALAAMRRALGAGTPVVAVAAGEQEALRRLFDVVPAGSPIGNSNRSALSKPAISMAPAALAPSQPSPAPKSDVSDFGTFMPKPAGPVSGGRGLSPPGFQAYDSGAGNRPPLPLAGEGWGGGKTQPANFQTGYEPAGPSHSALIPHLAALAGGVLGVAADEVESQDSFLEYGFDSVSLATLAMQVSERLRIDLPPARLFEMPSLSTLARHLAEAYPEAVAACLPLPDVAAPPSVAPAPDAAASVQRTLIAHLAALAGGVLGVAADEVEPHESFLEYGFDSVSLATLAMQVSERLRIDLPPARLFEMPSLSALARHLADAYPDAVAACLPAPAVTEPQTSADRLQASAARPAATFIAGETYISEPALKPSATAPFPTSSPAPHVPHAPATAAPVAIVGLSATLPGAADAQTLWQALLDGRDLLSDVPAERWDWRAFDGDPASGPGRGRVHRGGFIDGADRFDPLFFGLSAHEAARMDPQQRLVLQAVWQALEDAAIAPASLKGRNVAVFMGVSASDYNELFRDQGMEVGALTGTGMAHSILANRISHLLDLTGPSEPVDTACSSALVAVLRAVEAIRNGAEMALAGGVNLMLTPTLFHAFERAGMLSPEGVCRPFDAAANGYARGEGLGVLVLKPLAAAQRDGDAIHAVIRGGAIGHGGRAPSLTAPHPAGQAAVLSAAWQAAGIAPETLGYVEAHGTGTPLGDPVEIAGLVKAFGPALAHARCGIGSVKSNVGHLESAAGMAGLVKVILALRHRTLPPTAHLQTPNPQLPLPADGSLFLVDHAQAWARRTDAQGREMPRRAGVSSFGFGGVNAHLVIEEAPERPAAIAPREGPELIVLSARDGAALKRRQADLAAALPGIASLADLAFTLRAGRDAMAERFSAVVTSQAHLAEVLHAALAGEAPAGRWLAGRARRGAEAEPAPADLQAAAQAFADGALLDFSAWPATGTRLRLPVYSFAADRHWLPAPVGARAAAPVPPAPTREVPPDLRERLRAIVAEAAGFAPELITGDAGFETFGFDSLMAKSLHLRLEADFGTLPPSLPFECNTLDALSAYLAERLPATAAAVPAAPALAAAQPLPYARAHRPENAPIAIIGMAGRYPGAQTLDEFWRLLAEGRSAITEVPEDRWDWRPLWADSMDAAETQGGIYARWGGFLTDIEAFDPYAFRIPPAEAAQMDPQERLFLETAWHTFEDAGLVPRRLRASGQRVGVFAGVTTLSHALWGPELWRQGARAIPTADPWSIANRVSYVLDLTGPSMPVDTACSASLSALHLAVASLRRGECELALAGGVNLYSHPAKFMTLCRMRMLSPSGACRSFGAPADGFVPGEGVGAVLLRPLAEAEAAGDRIIGVLRGSAINHGGRTNGYTMPSPAAQAAVITAALADAGLAPGDIDTIEGHGTGTVLGDPIEVDGLARAFGARKTRGTLASVKANIGHLEAAAGIAGLTRLLLEFSHDTLAPAPYAATPNPAIAFDTAPFAPAAEARPFPRPLDAGGRPRPRRAGLSSFGAGGANAHLVVEDYAPAPALPPQDGPQLLPVCARDPAALEAMALALAERLEAADAPRLADVALTLQHGREAMAERLVVRAATPAEAASRLRAA
ncbi:SDR family NAD(P)-dependent oxidoreductase, partial [Xanthobacteraceae bacterium A53D]